MNKDDRIGELFEQHQSLRHQWLMADSERDQARIREKMHQCWEEVLRLDPDNEAALHNQAQDLMSDSRYDDALRAIKRLLHLRPHYAHALLLQAQCLAHRELPEMALTAYEEAILCYVAGDDNVGAEVFLASAWAQRAELELSIGRNEDAKRSLMEGMKACSTSVDGRDTHARLARELARVEERLRA